MEDSCNNYQDLFVAPVNSPSQDLQSENTSQGDEVDHSFSEDESLQSSIRP